MSMVSQDYVTVFVHGFPGRPVEGSFFGAELISRGVDLQCPDMTSGRGYMNTSISESLEAISDLYLKEKKPLRLLGGSLGAYTAALYASKFPEHIDRLLLFSPIFDLKETWPGILQFYFPDRSGEESLEKWRQEKQLVFHRHYFEEYVPVSVHYLEASLLHPKIPLVDVPVMYVFGVSDPIMSRETHFQFKEHHKNPEKVEYVEVDCGHVLDTDSSLSVFGRKSVEFLTYV